MSKKFSFHGTTHTLKSLGEKSGPELVSLYNELADGVDMPAVSRFATRQTGIDRVWKLLEELHELNTPEVPAAEETSPASSLSGFASSSARGTGKVSPLVAESREEEPATKAPKKTARRTQNRPRGTNLAPTGAPLVACVIGSKQASLRDALLDPKGATMEALIAALSGGKKPWTEATVRSGFGWDMKLKGYGVRSEVTDGVERFFLVVPAGQALPAHKSQRTSKAGAK